MEPQEKGGRLGTFVIGGVVGVVGAVAALRRKRPRARRDGPAGLGAFEGAPCYHEVVEEERSRERERAVPGERPLTRAER